MNLTDQEAEKRVISGMLHSEEACVEAISKLDESDFSDIFNIKVFSVISSLYTHNVRPTLPEVLKEGLKNGLIADSASNEKLSQISSHYIDDGNINYWIKQVKTKSQIRKLDAKLNQFKSAIQTAKDSDAEQIISQASEDFTSLSILSAEERIQDPAEVAKLGYEIVVEKMERYREMKSRNPYGALVLDGVPTGLETLDQITLGYKPGDLIILGAKTGHGKTAFALNTVEAISIKAKQPSLYVNTEMSKKQIALRWGCILSGIDHDKIRNGGITNEELVTIANAYAELEQSQFYPINIPNLTPTKLRSIARIAKMRKNIQLMVVDYVGRMETFDPRLQEWQVLYNIVKAQKQLAQNLDIAIIVLVQLNPDGTIQGAKKIANEADLMLKLIPVTQDEKDDYFAQSGIQYKDWNYKLEIEKNRDGRSGNSIPLFFDMPLQRIKQAERIKAVKITDWSDVERK